MPMVVSAVVMAVMTLVAMVSRSAKLWSVSHSESNLGVYLYPGLWVRNCCIIASPSAISSVLSAISYIFAAVPNIFSSISAVFDAV